jgi:hypothetical protein
MGIVPAIFVALLATFTATSKAVSPGALVRDMELAYDEVKQYMVQVEVQRPVEGRYRAEKEFTYTHKKPSHVRIDFRKPHRGTILIYPVKEGKVLVRPWGRRAFDLHLSPGSFLLGDPSGQRVDQMDFGRLINNISSSLNEGRRGSVEVLEAEKSLTLRVLAEDHFRKREVTLYEFDIDRKSRLPVEIREFTPEASAKRRIIFRDIRINPGIPEGFFSLNGE